MPKAPGQAFAMMQRLAEEHRKGKRPLGQASEAVRKMVVSGDVQDHTETPAPKSAAQMPSEVFPQGVKLRDPDDFTSLRKDIFDGVMDEVHQSFPQTYGGVRLELHDTAYEDPEEYDLTEQKNALLNNKVLGRRLRGTLKLFDDKTGQPLDEKRMTLMRVPYLTERGTFLHNGSEYTSLSQLRLIPGPYTRKKANGELETHFNIKRGTGSAFRVRFEPNTALYKMDVKQSSMRLYSLLHDIGVPDDELERAWGKEVFEVNRKAYDSRVFEKAYKHLVRKPNPDATRDEKAEAIKQALEAMQVNRRVVQKNLPNLYDTAKSASWRKEFSKSASKPMTVTYPGATPPAYHAAANQGLATVHFPTPVAAAKPAPAAPRPQPIAGPRQAQNSVVSRSTTQPRPLQQQTPAAPVQQQTPVTQPRQQQPVATPPRQTPPPALQRTQTSFNPNSFKDFLWNQENAAKKGYNPSSQAWTPIPATGKNPAMPYEVGPGILVKDRRSYTNQEVNSLMDRSINEHMARARRSVDSVHGRGAFDRLPENYRYGLLDFAYNGVQAPKLTAAMVNNDIAGIQRESKRFYTEKGVKKPLDRRNAAWWNTFVAPYQNQKVASDTFAWLSHVFVKLAKGAIVMLPTGNGKYLLEKNPDQHEHAPGKLRPPGGGQEPGEDMKQTIAREIHEEFGIPPETTEDKIRLLGYEYRDKFKGSAVFELKDHGLQPGTYQASNDPDERITLVEADLDDPDYHGPKLDKLISTAA